MILVIAEKPSLGRAIADALPGTASGKDPITKGEYKITWLYGHILSLKEPEDFDSKYKRWSFDNLPIYFSPWGQKPREDTKDKLNMIGNLLKEADTVIHAGDPDDEGQLLVDEILGWFHYKGKVLRLDTANTTKAGMQKALSKMKDNNSQKVYGYAAYARSISDMIVGVNMSRFYTLLRNGGAIDVPGQSVAGKPLTVGRVQTPTLGLVVNRDLLIEGHKKTVYFTITGTIHMDGKDVPVEVQIDKDSHLLTDGRLLDEAIAKEIESKLAGRKFENIHVAKKTEYEKPPLPFDLTEITTYCGNKFGYSPNDTLEITQNLRDKYNAITYNRSNCRYLTSEHFAEAPATLAQVSKNISYRPKELDPTIKSDAFNDKQVTIHFGIIPTNTYVDLNKLTQREKNVYLAVCKYYFAQFLPPAEKEKTGFKIPFEDGCITATSTKVIKPGYRAVFSELKAPECSCLSDIATGYYDGVMNSTEINQKETKPPARYTKVSLNKDMTCISKYVTDPEIKKLLIEKDKDVKGENGSIGTSATRAGIIDNLVARGYLEENSKKQLISTPLGRSFYQLLPDELKKADMTAKWWVIQEQIKNKESKFNDLPQSVFETCQRIMDENADKIVKAKSAPSSYIASNKEVIGKCPVCGKPVYETNLSFGCSGYKDGCTFTIWKKAKGGMFQKTIISKTVAKKLLNGETVEFRKLYSPKTNKTFTGNVKLKNTASQYGAEYELSFEEKK